MSEENFEGITKQDMEDFKKEAFHLKNINNDVINLTEKYLNFRLQLIAIAGATFSIYIALHTPNTVSGGFTTYGFVLLATSLWFGFLSIVFSLVNSVSNIFYRLFDFDKSMENKSEGYKKLWKLAGFPAEPQLYDKSYKEMEVKELGRTVLKSVRDFSTSTTQLISFALGVGQILAFLISTTLLVVDLLPF